MTIAAIPTRYAGVNFRSRLEARWAAFFDQCGLTWGYEPIDLNGYIPDFLVELPHARILFEVKPGLDVGDLRAACPKIEASGWRRMAWIGGALGDVLIRSLAAGPCGPCIAEILHADSPALPVSECRCSDLGWEDLDSFRVCPSRWREAGNRVQWNAVTPR